jgi:aryl-alcohol dehydrogenase-like predicted oxidoreductase
MQNHYNLVYREEEREMIPLCLDQAVGIIPWSPLARACSPVAATEAASGTRFGPAPTPTPTDVRRVGLRRGRRGPRGRAERGLPMAQVALAWLLGRPGVVAPIVGATKLNHLEDAIAAVDVTLTEDEIRRLEEPYRPHPILGHS